jgi:hypothetical protein
MTAAGAHRERRSLAVLACLGLTAAACGSGGSAFASAPPPSGGRVGSIARTCTPPHYPSVGYFDSIVVTGTTCATGRRFVLAFYRCRTTSGLAGRCRKAVVGFKCTETRRSIPTEIDARDTCTKGSARIVSVWQQDIVS